jgi:hypothetical protein
MTISNPFLQFDEALNLLSNMDFDDNGIHLHTGKAWNRYGFLADGTHRKTGTPYSPQGHDAQGWTADGWHRSGWNAEGLNKATGTRYNAEGIDIDGYDENGWQAKGNKPWKRFSERDYLRSELHTELPLHKETGTTYAPDGFNFFGFDAQGYDRAGFDRIGDEKTHIGYNREGFDPDGFNENGYDREGYNSAGFDRDGFTREGKHVVTKTSWSPKGVHAVTRTAFDEQGYDIQGYDKRGYGRDGFNAAGWNFNHINRETGASYNAKGLTEGGLNAEGVYSNGFDTFGYCAGEKAPSRVYILDAWNRNIIADKLRDEDTDHRNRTPRNLYREGWRHVPGQGFNPEKGIYFAVDAFTHKGTGTSLNPDGFTVLGLDAAGERNERGFNLTTGIHAVTGTKFDEQGWNLNRTERVTA